MTESDLSRVISLDRTDDFRKIYQQPQFLWEVNVEIFHLAGISFLNLLINLKHKKIGRYITKERSKKSYPGTKNYKIFRPGENVGK